MKALPYLRKKDKISLLSSFEFIDNANINIHRDLTTCEVPSIDDLKSNFNLTYRNLMQQFEQSIVREVSLRKTLNLELKDLIGKYIMNLDLVHSSSGRLEIPTASKSQSFFNSLMSSDAIDFSSKFITTQNVCPYLFSINHHEKNPLLPLMQNVNQYEANCSAVGSSVESILYFNKCKAVISDAGKNANAFYVDFS